MNSLHRAFFTPKISVNKVKMDSVNKNRSPSAKNQSSVIRYPKAEIKRYPTLFCLADVMIYVNHNRRRCKIAS